MTSWGETLEGRPPLLYYVHRRNRLKLLACCRPYAILIPILDFQGAIMSEQSRILVIAPEEELGSTLINALRSDGYLVQGASSAAGAIRLLWSETHRLVIADLQLASADDFELVQWLRLYYPQTSVLLLAPPDAGELRAQALGRGVAAIVEKPVDLQQLRSEVRRLLTQPGFSASLDSFDLLDVIQIVTMSRKKIALVVNTGQDECGLLRFQNGELVWAEYGILRGEEAFFALAAYKNGTVIHQPWDGEITPNVTQPLSRLILQALQYRSKYGGAGQAGGQLQAAPSAGEADPLAVIDDRPFGLGIAEEANAAAGKTLSTAGAPSHGGEAAREEQEREWWMATGYFPGLGRDGGPARAGNVRQPESDVLPKLPITGHFPAASAPGATGALPPTPGPGTGRLPPAPAAPELPSWLTEQPTQGQLPSVFPGARPADGRQPSPPRSQLTSTTSGRLPGLPQSEQPLHRPLSNDTGMRLRRVTLAEGQDRSAPPPASGPLQSLISLARPSGPLPSPTPPAAPGASPSAAPAAPLPPKTDALTGPRPAVAAGNQPRVHPLTAPAPAAAGSGPLRSTRRNIGAIVAALQTLGYAIPGFVATAVVNMDGQPIAQVSVDDLDLSAVSAHLKTALQELLRSLELGSWGNYEELVLTSSHHRFLLRLIEGGSVAFHVLITTREADLGESMKVMANVEGAIAAAL
jgi:DNA-binding response OmpR family regulator/predicted regulator of Ras-like GTPase activity (Roadblock/LC7/MglB family)